MVLPSTFCVRISGLPTVSSKPSRRIISMRMASCSSPRPITLNVSGRDLLHADRNVGEQFFIEPILQDCAR